MLMKNWFIDDVVSELLLINPPLQNCTHDVQINGIYNNFLACQHDMGNVI